MDVVSVLASVITAVVALGWLDLLRPAPRRKLVTDRPWAIGLLLFSAWVLLFWGVRLAGPPPGAARLLLHVRLVLAAASVVPGIFIFRPSSRDLRQGKRFSKQGDLDHAAAAYRRVAGSGRRGEVPEGAFRLGCVLLRQGDQDGAGIAFQLAIESGDPRIVPAAAFNLGYLLELQGDTEGARAAYEQVIGIRGARHAARAAWRLGDVLQQKGDTEGARAAYRRAIAHGPPEVREAAARALAELDGTQDGE